MSDLTSENLLSVSTRDAGIVIDLDVGHIRDLVFHAEGGDIVPLHTAHWVGGGDADLPDELPPVERRLSGDFLCAPFAASDVEEAPPHGWTANSPWTEVEVVEDSEKAYAKLRLEKQVMGAQVEKELLILAGSHLLYQSHRFTGGKGMLPVAHHVMTRMESGGIFAHSPIDHAWTHETPLETNMNLLKHPAKSADLAEFPREEGGIANLAEFPLAGGYEDFLTLVEKKGSRLGWTAVQRKAEEDVVFVVKDPFMMPVTMLWHSNGGRRRKPWSSKHNGVLGIEDGISYGCAGHAASIGENEMTRKNFATCLMLDPNGSVELHHIIGAFRRPEGWTKTASVDYDGDKLVVMDRRDNIKVFDALPGYFPEHAG